MHLISFGGCDSEQCADGRKAGHLGKGCNKGLVEIYARDVRIAFGYQSGLGSHHAAVGTELVET